MNKEKIYDVISSWLLEAEEQYDFALKEYDINPENETYNERIRDLRQEIMTYKRILKLFKNKI